MVLIPHIGAGRGIEPHSPSSDQPLKKHHVRPRHKFGGRYRNRTDQAICLQSKSGYPSPSPIFLIRQDSNLQSLSCSSNSFHLLCKQGGLRVRLRPSRIPIPATYHTKLGSPGMDRTYDILVNSQTQLPLCYRGIEFVGAYGVVPQTFIGF